MNIAQKLAYADQHLESIATHDDADAAVVLAALDHIVDRVAVHKAAVNAKVAAEIAAQVGEG